MNKKLLILFSLCTIMTNQVSICSYKNNFKKVFTPKNFGKWTNKFFTWTPFVGMLSSLSSEKLKKFNSQFEEDFKISPTLNKQAQEELYNAFIDPKKLFHEDPTSPLNLEKYGIERTYNDNNKIIIPYSYAKILNDPTADKNLVLAKIMKLNIEQKNDYDKKIIERQPFYYAFSVLALEEIFGKISKPIKLAKNLIPMKKLRSSFAGKALSYPWHTAKGYSSAAIKQGLAIQPIIIEKYRNTYQTYDEMKHLDPKKLDKILEAEQMDNFKTSKQLLDLPLYYNLLYLTQKPHPNLLIDYIQEKRDRLIK